MSGPKRLSSNTKSAQPRDPGAPLTKVEKLAVFNRYAFPVLAVFGPVVLALLFGTNGQ